MYNTLAIDRKKKKIRSKIRELGVLRLTVFKSNKNIYAQVFTHDGSKVVISASSLDKEFRILYLKEKTKLNKCEIASFVGELLSIRMKKLDIFNVAFDRSGYKFHGRVKFLALSLNKNGIKC